MGVGDVNAVVQYLRSPEALAAVLAGAALVYPINMFFFRNRLKEQERMIQALTKQRDDLLERLERERHEFKLHLLNETSTISKLKGDVAHMQDALRRAGGSN